MLAPVPAPAVQVVHEVVAVPAVATSGAPDHVMTCSCVRPSARRLMGAHRIDAPPSRSAAVADSCTPSTRNHAPPAPKRDAADVPLPASIALYVPGRVAAVASLWQAMSAAASPAPPVIVPDDRKARRPVL